MATFRSRRGEGTGAGGLPFRHDLRSGRAHYQGGGQRYLREEAQTKRYKGIFGATDDPIVSSDIIQDPRASIADLGMTRVVDGNLVKVMAWYDSEWGYASQMMRVGLSPIQPARTARSAHNRWHHTLVVMTSVVSTGQGF